MLKNSRSKARHPLSIGVMRFWVLLRLLEIKLVSLTLLVRVKRTIFNKSIKDIHFNNNKNS